ncbi:MAG TPA: DNA-binding response regulator, partial [Lachnoclostridium sp.]|nr:DNA-binding response regulator [Lachnoclostridium sp.]
MASHYGESAINVAKIAGAVGISEGHLSHCFKKETGYTVMGWLTRYRMKKAVEL